MAEYFAGLDVSDRTTAICVVTKSGEPIWEGSAETDPKALASALKPYRGLLSAVGLEASTKSAWLYKSLSEKRLPVVCLESRHAHAILATRRNKTDASDARGLAIILSRGLYHQSYIKTVEAQHLRLLLTLRKVLQRKSNDLYISLRMTCKNFGASIERNGPKLAITGPRDKTLTALAQPIQRAYAAVLAEFEGLDDLVKRKANADAVCRRFMTIPGVGPITALTFRAAVDEPTRFSSSRNVAAHFGLTPRRFQSGQTDVTGHITKRGDQSVRSMLYDAAHTLIVVSHSRAPLRLWALALAERRGRKIATVATARKLAVIMHRMWITGRDFDASPAV